MLLGAQFEVSLPTHGFASHGYVLGARQTKAQGLGGGRTRGAHAGYGAGHGEFHLTETAHGGPRPVR